MPPADPAAPAARAEGAGPEPAAAITAESSAETSAPTGGVTPPISTSGISGSGPPAGGSSAGGGASGIGTCPRHFQTTTLLGRLAENSQFVQNSSAGRIVSDCGDQLVTFNIESCFHHGYTTKQWDASP